MASRARRRPAELEILNGYCIFSRFIYCSDLKHKQMNRKLFKAVKPQYVKRLTVGLVHRVSSPHSSSPDKHPSRCRAGGRKVTTLEGFSDPTSDIMGFNFSECRWLSCKSVGKKTLSLMYSCMASYSLWLLGLKISITFNKYTSHLPLPTISLPSSSFPSENMSTNVYCMPLVSKALWDIKTI